MCSCKVLRIFVFFLASLSTYSFKSLSGNAGLFGVV